MTGQPAGRAASADQPQDGLLVVDKPSGLTSHDVVARVRRVLRTRRVGHAGTLDPMATGVLVVGVGRATRLLGHLALTDKEYRATIRLGQATVTDDAEGGTTEAPGAAGVDQAAVRAGIAALTGDILQVPAKVSAIKVDGRRSYARMRQGEDVELAARPVTVSSFVLHDQRPAEAVDGTPVLDLDVTVTCSTGTYVRALARDLGADLGVGGHLTALRRTRVGPYLLADACPLPEFEESPGSSRSPRIMPIAEAAAAAFPRWWVDERRARLLANGVRIDMPTIRTPADAAPAEGAGSTPEAVAGGAAGEGEGPAGDGGGPTGPVAVFDPEGRLVALVEESGGRAKWLAVFAG